MGLLVDMGIRTAYSSSLVIVLPFFSGCALDRTISIYIRYCGLFIIPYELNENLRCLIFRARINEELAKSNFDFYLELNLMCI